MAYPRIVWNGNNLDFPQSVSGFERVREAARNQHFSASGKSSTITEHIFDMVKIEMKKFASRAFYRDLQAWWSWAARGQTYAFALNSADMINLTLDDAAASGQKVVPLASTTGVVAGSYYRIRSANGLQEEIGQVDTISVGVSVTLIANLKYTYASGDAFRSEDYFPSVVSLDDEFPAEEIELLAFTMKHKFREAS